MRIEVNASLYDRVAGQEAVGFSTTTNRVCGNTGCNHGCTITNYGCVSLPVADDGGEDSLNSPNG